MVWPGGTELRVTEDSSKNKCRARIHGSRTAIEDGSSRQLSTRSRYWCVSTRDVLPCVDGLGSRGGASAEGDPPVCRLFAPEGGFRFFATPSFGAFSLLPKWPTFPLRYPAMRIRASGHATVADWPL
jgi:hypothetical protein